MRAAIRLVSCLGNNVPVIWMRASHNQPAKHHCNNSFIVRQSLAPRGTLLSLRGLYSIGNRDADGVIRPSQIKRAATAILFSLIMAWILGFGGLLAGGYLWAHFGRSPKDPDDSCGYLFSLALAGLIAVTAGSVSLWRFWPRNPAISSQSHRS